MLKIAIERATMPPTSMFGYYFPCTTQGYDATSYDPQYSDGIVTKEDVNNMVGEVNSNKTIGYTS